MKLHELHVLVGKASPGHHGSGVAGASVGRGGAEIGLAVTSGSQNGVLGPESVNGTVLKAKSNDSDAFAIFHQEIESEVFNEVVAIVSEIIDILHSRKKTNGTEI